ncbi:MAG: MFS transporter [Janthinobacterium lividum]
MPTVTPDNLRTANAADQAYSKVIWRFMPLLFICYVVAYLDRVNVGFAKLNMLSDLGFSEAAYGFGAGVFFVGYFLFEVPSNLLLHKVGARRWISRIMVSWGIVSALTAVVTTPYMFYVLRFFLGVAEAGFFPGIILYLTFWFPSHRRAKMVAFLMAGNPVAGIVGGPLSGYLIYAFAGYGGLHGWQWLFMLEAIPAVLLGVVVFFFLDDSVAQAKWLSPADREVVEREIRIDAAGKSLNTIAKMFASSQTYLFCLTLFGIVMGSYAIGFWLPTIIKNTGISDVRTVGLLTAIPYLVALASMLLTGRSADARRERRWHVAGPQIVAAAGFVICGLAGRDNTAMAMFGMVLATAGVVTALPMFWALPTAVLGGAGAAAGIALINSTGNLAGFVSPTILGALNEYTHNLSSGLFLIAGCLIASALLVLVFIPARVVNR